MKSTLTAVVATLFVILAGCQPDANQPAETNAQLAFRAKVQADAHAEEMLHLSLQLDQQKYYHDVERKVLDACVAKGGTPAEGNGQIFCQPSIKQIESARGSAADCLARGGSIVQVGDQWRCSK